MKVTVPVFMHAHQCYSIVTHFLHEYTIMKIWTLYFVCLHIDTPIHRRLSLGYNIMQH